MKSRREIIEHKASLLSHGITFPLDCFEHIKKPFYDNRFVYGQTSLGAVRSRRLPQLLRLDYGIVVAVLYRNQSPWDLTIDNDCLVTLAYRGKPTVKAKLPERPAYFGLQTNEGLFVENVVAVAGEDTPGFFLYPYCAYFDLGIPCKFCGMKKARETVGRRMESAFADMTIREATKQFTGTDWRPIQLISISTGTCRSDEEYRTDVIRKIRVMTDTLPRSIPIHVLTHPPRDLCLIDEYKEAGVTTIAFNLEVFDRTAFANLCPGKHQIYGYDQWIEALDYAKMVFGDYNVYCGLVWGLEPAERVMEGNAFFIERGIGIASNIFHADPTCAMSCSSHPAVEDIIQIADHQIDLYRKFPKAKTIFQVSMRSTLDWELMQEARQ